MKKIVLVILLVIIIVCGIATYDSILDKSEVAVTPDASEENSSWTITQYGSAGGEQMMSFSIEGNVDGLIIVDGGYENVEGDVNNILEVIKKHKNVVDTWVVTHLDSDHAGVFLNIMKNHPEVTIKNVYTENIPELEKCKASTPWEVDWSTYEDFVKFGTENKNIKSLSEGDIIEDVIGLNLEVLWSYSEWVDTYSSNILNNGALVFKLSGKEESMLFFADVQDGKIGNELIRKHQEKLKADYVQIGHHGNNSMPAEIYDIINPKVAFIPAPNWIFENPNNVSWYTGAKIRDLLTEKGVTVYSDKDCPVSVTMK